MFTRAVRVLMWVVVAMLTISVIVGLSKEPNANKLTQQITAGLIGAYGFGLGGGVATLFGVFGTKNVGESVIYMLAAVAAVYVVWATIVLGPLIAIGIAVAIPVCVLVLWAVGRFIITGK